MPSSNSAVDGPLPLILMVLTFVTGVVDSVSYLTLGHVFVANMTGNVVFLGFAAGGAEDLSVAAAAVAISSFFLGALIGGRLESSTGQHRGRFLALSTYAEFAAVAAGLVVSMASFQAGERVSAYALIVILGFAMGLQNATARGLRIPDLTTTVLTLTVAGIAADSRLAGGKSSNTGRRMLAILAMLAGALAGTVLILQAGVSAALALAVALLASTAIAGYRLSSSSAAWTAPARNAPSM